MRREQGGTKGAVIIYLITLGEGSGTLFKKPPWGGGGGEGSNGIKNGGKPWGLFSIPFIPNESMEGAIFFILWGRKIAERILPYSRMGIVFSTERLSRERAQRRLQLKKKRLRLAKIEWM